LSPVSPPAAAAGAVDAALGVCVWTSEGGTAGAAATTTGGTDALRGSWTLSAAAGTTAAGPRGAATVGNASVGGGALTTVGSLWGAGTATGRLDEATGSVGNVMVGSSSSAMSSSSDKDDRATVVAGTMGLGNGAGAGAGAGADRSSLETDTGMGVGTIFDAVAETSAGTRAEATVGTGTETDMATVLGAAPACVGVDLTASTTRVGLTVAGVVVTDGVATLAKLLEGKVTRVNVRGVLVTAVTGLKEMTWLTSMSSSSSCSSSLEIVVDKSVEAREGVEVNPDDEDATELITGSGTVVTG
jgi:hypothetical protein